MGSNMVDVKHGRWTRNWVNGVIHQMRGGQNPQVNGQDHIVQSGKLLLLIFKGGNY